MGKGWPGSYEVIDLSLDVNQVCCHCRPGEVDDWPVTPAETPQEGSQETHTHTKTATQPQTLTAKVLFHQ